jgi:translation elongation factor EF-G
MLFEAILVEFQICSFIVNKLDRMGANYEDLIKTIRTKLTDEILECQRYHGVGGKQVQIEDIPLDDEELQMKLLLSSETLIKKYDESQEITTKDYETEFIHLIRGGKLYPVMGGVALKNQGINSLMDMLTKIMADVKPQMDILSAYVFKVDFDQKGQNVFFSGFSAELLLSDKMYISRLMNSADWFQSH